METVQPRVRRPRPKVVTLSERAAERVREIMARAEKPYVGLRVGVKNGGCAGQEYVLEYAEAANPLDEVVEDKGVTILIERLGLLGIGQHVFLPGAAAVLHADAQPRVGLFGVRQDLAHALGGAFGEGHDLGPRPPRPQAQG